MTRRLYRSRTDTVIGGVAAGLATYLNTDPAIVRVGWAVLALITNGVAVLAYLVAWVAVPEEPKPAADATDEDGASAAPEHEAAPANPRESRAALFVGAGLVLLGAWFLAREYLPIDGDLLWPLVLIGIGVLILVTSARRRTEG